MSDTNDDQKAVGETETPPAASSVSEAECKLSCLNDNCNDAEMLSSEADVITPEKHVNAVISEQSTEKDRESDTETANVSNDTEVVGEEKEDDVKTIENDVPSSSRGESVAERKIGHETVEETMDEATKCEASAAAHQQSVYQIKWIKWNDSKVPIITQNENGPCPLIAVINVLLLLGKIKLSYVQEIITADQLMEYLGDCILESAPKNISEGARLNYEQNMHDAIAVVPKLQTGLDVNVKFTGVHDFEYTPECIIFDLLNIPLYHGWLVDPQATDVVNAVGKLSYNQLVEKIITNKSSSNCDLVTEALISESFLEKSASQLTYYGLCELNEVLKPNELAVLFRNNHFCTVFKHESELLQLVTDQGFLTENNVVWETLSNIEGDCQFVDAKFVTVPPKPAPVAVAPVVPALAVGIELNSPEQINRDYLVALSLQEQQKREEEEAKVWQEYKEKELGATSEMTDEELARRLQAEEQRQATQSSRPETASETTAGGRPGDPVAKSTRQSPVDSRSGKKKSDVCFLRRRK